ncbi:MAG: PLP-dependent aminotransferase family protein [Clostridia bacterium]|nr:PLP-dependent aminotransferase family protein [Clostridia bacterium]
MNVGIEKGFLWEQLYSQLKDQIQRGDYAPLTKLPSKREMAARLGVSINTVTAAYARLEDEGYIEAKERSGFFVKAIDELIHFTADPIKSKAEREEEFEADFSPYRVDREHFPYTIWRRLLRQSVEQTGEDMLLPPPPQGDASLKTAICAYLRQSRSIDCDPESVIVGGGTGSLLRMLCGILPKGTIATEEPVYRSAEAVFRAMGRETHPLYDLSQLSDSEAAAIYLTPSHQFPLGYSLPVAERVALLNWAASDSGRYIIEDDYDSEFRYSGRPLPPIKSLDRYDRVVYIGTFSKCIAPSLKISYAVLPGELLAAFSPVYLSAVSRLEQQTLALFINGGYFERHLNRMRSVYAKKRALLTDVFRDCEIFGENAGHHIIVKLPGLSEAELVDRAAQKRIKVYPISPYFMQGIPKQYTSCVMLGYGSLTESEISYYASVLREVWQV